MPEDNKASTRVPDAPFDASEALPHGSSLLAFVASGVAALLWLRRRLSSDNKEIAKDGSEVTFLNTLQEELRVSKETLHVVSAERNQLAEQVGSLKAMVEYLRPLVAQQQRRIEILERKLGINIESLDTGPGDLK